MDLPIEVETLGGSKLKIEKVDGDIIVGGQKVVQPDIMATNGVIHGVDGVVMATDPQTSDSTDDAKDELQPIVETLSALPDYSTLVAAVGVAADSEGKKIVDDLVAGGPYTAGPGKSVHTVPYLSCTVTFLSRSVKIFCCCCCCPPNSLTP
jgi:hypothetical protein